MKTIAWIIMVTKQCSHWAYLWIIYVPRLLVHFFRRTKYYKSPSYFPELPRKNMLHIISDQLLHIIRYQRIEDFYFAYGLDIKNFRHSSDYVDYNVFKCFRDGRNRPSSKPFDYTGILRDKFYFNIFSKAIGFPSSSNVGLISEGRIFILETKKHLDLAEFFSKGQVDVFCKKIDAEDGKSIYSVARDGELMNVNGDRLSLEQCCDLLSNGQWTVEQRIHQHEIYASFHPASVNTLRIYTARDPHNGEIVTLPSIFRIGTNGRNVDNWARGGLIVELFEDGKLGKYAFYRPQYGLKTAEHPDSHIVFENFKLPYVTESFAMVKELHKFLYGIHSIGWDVAVTPDGPIVVEANDNWEISANQIASHGLQSEFRRLFINK